MIETPQHQNLTISWNWISVKERLPENRERVLIFGKDKSDNECILIDSYSNDYWITEGMYDIKITHWMPLPEPPGKE